VFELLKFGGMIDTERLDYPSVLALAKAYERFGFEYTGVFDHFLPIYSRDDAAVLECWTTLGALARDTSSIRLGPFVTCTSYRNPLIVAKMAANIDNVSDGRLYLGVGLGWYDKEFRAMGVEFGTFSERLARTSEFIEVLKRLWSEKSTTYSGKYFAISRSLAYPRPTQKPHPPLMIGTEKGGDKVLKLISRFADIANVGWNMSLETLANKFAAVDKECRSAGREPSSILKSTNFDLILGETEAEVKKRIESTELKFRPKFGGMKAYKAKIGGGLVGTPEQCARKLQRLKKMGVDLVFLQPMDSPKIETTELFAKSFL